MSGKTAKKARASTSPGGRRGKPLTLGSSRPWGRYALYGLVGLLAAAIVTVAVIANRGGKSPSADPVTAIAGVADYRARDAGSLTRNHKNGVLTYKQNPPVGGDHNQVWQSCQGAVYDAPIANENAVHSLEHGAVWITYRPDLPADQITVLAGKVRGVDYTLLSPYPNQDTPVSVQAWGYQLKLDAAADPRLDQFMNATRIKAAPEPGAPCSGGKTTTGTTP